MIFKKIFSKAKLIFNALERICLFKKWAIPGLFLFIFVFCTNKQYVFTTNQIEKCPSNMC